MKRLNFARPESSMKRFSAILFAITLLAVYPFSKSFSNGVTISNVVATQGSATVSFDITWNNSWRSTTTTAKNWDAVWVFVKWRGCDTASTSPFVHGLVSTNYNDHNFNVNGASSPGGLEATDRFGNAGVIDAAPNNTGVMLRNLNPQTGNVTSSARVTLNIPNLGATAGGENLDIRVFAIEMVFVPQSPFILGDGNGYTASNNSFTSIAAPSSGNIYPIQIISETPQNVFELSSTFCGSSGCLLTGPFQKGYNAFYIMKYEISQGQWADFLNAISQGSQNVHYFSNSANRYTILYNSGNVAQPYSANRPYRAMSQLSWADASTFLEWAALRPLSELEYEKACRGTEEAIPYQKAWGTPAGTVPAVSGISGTENGSETISTSGANINAGTTAGAVTYTTGTAGIDNSAGPLRGGIFATSITTSRFATGMSFYGVMDLSGNVAEYYISALVGITGSNTNMNGGNGGLAIALGDGGGWSSNMSASGTTLGYQIVPSWPFADDTATPPGPSNTIIKRGGSWATTSGATNAPAIETNVSYRGSGSTNSRSSNTGGRGGR